MKNINQPDEKIKYLDDLKRRFGSWSEDVEKLLQKLNIGWMCVENPPPNQEHSDRLYESEKIRLAMYFMNRDPLPYNDIERKFLESHKAQDLDTWFERYSVRWGVITSDGSFISLREMLNRQVQLKAAYTVRSPILETS